MKPKHLLVIGPATGYASYPTVIKGLIRGLRGAGPIAVADTSGVGNCPADGELDGEGVLWLPADKVRFIGLGELPDDIDFGNFVVCMNPHPTLVENLSENGFDVIGMHVGDVDQIPLAWQATVAKEVLTITPSDWMAALLEPHAKEVLVVPHGIGPAFRRNGPKLPAPLEGRKLLHTCTAMYFPERKSTPAVLDAFELLSERYPARLTLLIQRQTKPLKRLLERLSPGARDAVDLIERPEGLAAEDMVGLYRGHDLLVCPSRAEGLGLQPLEMRACGRPVVQTACTGMATHFTDGLPAAGVMVVPHGELTTAWGDFGRAPSVASDDIYAACSFVLDNYGDFAEAAWEEADAVAERWSWENVTRGLVEWITSRR